MAEQSSSHLASSQPVPRLTHDIFHYLRGYLKTNGLHGAAKALIPANKDFHSTFIDVIDYKRIRLNSNNAEKLFHGLLRCEFDEGPYARQWRRLRPDDTLDTPVPMSNDDSTDDTHARRMGQLEQCTHLELQDYAALTCVLDAADTICDTSFFPNVDHLILGPELMAHLAMSEDDSRDFTLERLVDRLLPAHLCVTYGHCERDAFEQRRFEGWEPLDDEADIMEWREGAGRFDWRYRADHGISNIVDYLLTAWRLESLTCHGITTQSLPTQHAPLLRFFYSSSPPPQSAGVAIGRDHQVERIREIADTLCLIEGPTDRVELVDADVNFPATFSSGEEPVDRAWWTDDPLFGRTVLPESTLIESSAERRKETLDKFVQDVFEQIRPEHIVEAVQAQVTFATPEQAAPCVCCGGK